MDSDTFNLGSAIEEHAELSKSSAHNANLIDTLNNDNAKIQDIMAQRRKNLLRQEEEINKLIEIRNKKYNDLSLEEKKILLPVIKREIDYEEKKQINDQRIAQELINDKLRQLQLQKEIKVDETSTNAKKSLYEASLEKMFYENQKKYLE